MEFTNNRKPLFIPSKTVPKLSQKELKQQQVTDKRVQQLLQSQLEKLKLKSHHLAGEPNRTIDEENKFSLPSRYEIVHILGKGSYGTVCSARDNKNPENTYCIAVKKITNIFFREILLKRAIRELKFINYFKGHKNIVNLIDLELVVEKPYEGLYCYQELIDYDLAKVIHSSVYLGEFHIKFFFYQIVCGLKYIHSADVIHRDLKPGNILCTLNGCLKICDFGLARGVASKYFNTRVSHQDITNYVATRWYRAPELILSHKTYDKSIDMWSLGCILGEFYERRPLFMGKDAMNQIFQILQVLGSPSKSLLKSFSSRYANSLCSDSNSNIEKQDWKKIFPNASMDAVDLLDRLLDWDPAERITINQAIEHPFFKDVRKIDDEPDCPYGSFDFTYEEKLDSMQKLREYLIVEVDNFKRERVILDNPTQNRLNNPQLIQNSYYK
ncbi:hypothetical protein TBLA_0A06670 [Henningerozyma blattae CBS 6284]|uniref:Protein kinase domain-containing protein n=1 Tax=Henningerozyma blattae (strain ATCC 34711 / CBS 6284 / DSM 70876 / NBRC 10599 / NRRL Y-10934 / UCD 77-7) TaxID=1071380 RepID=I2GWF7_HENB6|nr:hypothetical protein TBLA_0A06670 [Tetrapisispora blattae CBS 6284]CCH58459.1 hypothetical protein TBLA_0A06670 [Tetrapisispora blattae CBS 6284]